MVAAAESIVANNKELSDKCMCMKLPMVVYSSSEAAHPLALSNTSAAHVIHKLPYVHHHGDDTKKKRPTFSV